MFGINSKVKLKSTYLLGILTLCMIYSGYAQSSINQVNANGERTGVWKKYYPNKNLRYSGQFLKGKETGVFKFYSEANPSQPICIKTFDARGIAMTRYFDKKGQLESEGQFKGKHRIGKWIYYAEGSKTILLEEHYKEGLLHGSSITYYSKGVIAQQQRYVSGKLQGEARRYTKKGSLMEIVHYQAGKLHGKAIYYDTNGSLTASGQYVNDVKTGVWEYVKDGEKVQKRFNK